MVGVVAVGPAVHAVVIGSGSISAVVVAAVLLSMVTLGVLAALGPAARSTAAAPAR